LVGTEITLDVGGLTLTYSKNHRGLDHGALYQEKDRKRLRSEQINYDYYAENGEDPGPQEMALSRSLREVLPRLELLGFTLDRVQGDYDGSADAWRDERQSLADDDAEPASDLMTFDEFRDFATLHPLRTLDDTPIFDNDEKSKARIRGRFSDEAITTRIPRFSPYDSHAYSERSYFADLMGVMHPYSILRVLADSAAKARKIR
jgi:hypothetical protein